MSLNLFRISFSSFYLITIYSYSWLSIQSCKYFYPWNSLEEYTQEQTYTPINQRQSWERYETRQSERHEIKLYLT